MTTKHTPGPWTTIIAQPGNMLEVVNDKREYVCSLLGGDEHKQENAALIASAPELLEALGAMSNELSHLYYNGQILANAPERDRIRQYIITAENAIEKAIGDSNA